MMSILIVSFLVSAIGTLLVIRASRGLPHLSHDHDLSGPQKFHASPVPRVGGVGVVLGVVAVASLQALRDPASRPLLLVVICCSMPTFLSGLFEDFFKNVSPSRRLVFTVISAALAAWFAGAVIDRIGFDCLEWMFAVPAIAVLLTVFAVSGVTNAVNIIDGFNGLASMCVVMMMAASAVVAFRVGDVEVGGMALACIGAVLGFFVWNFPRGLVFLGDGGAYFLGFMVCQVTLLLIHRNRSVSPMFPLVVCVYPIFETLFSIYRKKVIRKMSPGVPDGVHLHMLVYKRLMPRGADRATAAAKTLRNSMTSPYLWALCLVSVVPAVVFWDRTAVLGWCLVAFGVLYTFLYWRIVRFRVPRWMRAGA